LRQLDLYSEQVFFSSELRKFPYKTISETLILVSLTFLRDILIQFTIGDKEGEIPELFADEVFLCSIVFLMFFQLNSFALSIFKYGHEAITVQSQLDDRTQNIVEKKERKGIIIDKEAFVNRIKMLVIGNSICLELIVWSSIDENGLSIFVY
jgi:hypothetical protein